MTENDGGEIPSLMLKTESLSINDEEKDIGAITMHNHKIFNTKSYKIGEKLYYLTTETEKRFVCIPGFPEFIVHETTPVTKYVTDDIVCPMLNPAPTEAELTMEERTTIKEKTYQRFGNGVVFVYTKKSLETDIRLPNGPWVNTYKKDFPEVKRQPPVSFF